MHVTHQSETKTFDTAGPGIHFTACFDDCLLDPQPVTSGAQLALLFHLVMDTQPIPRPPAGATDDAILRRAVLGWEAEGQDGPPLLVVSLEGKYTKEELSFRCGPGCCCCTMHH